MVKMKSNGKEETSKDFFPILPCDPTWSTQVEKFHDLLASVAECNFTLAGFVRSSQIPKCDKVGLKAIIGPPRGEYPDVWADVAAKDWLGKSGKSDSIFGYYIADEPSAIRFPELAKVVATVRKYAPGKQAYFCLFPGYATIGAPNKSQLGTASFTEYLEQFIAKVKPDILNYDNYMIVSSDNLQSRDNGALYFRDLMEFRRVAQKHGLPFWNTVCSSQIRPYTTIPSLSNLLLQAYTTLAAGGRGISWYTYFQDPYVWDDEEPIDKDGRGNAVLHTSYAYAPINKDGRRTDTWYYLREVNRQVKLLGPMMNRLNSTGVYFTDPAPADGLPKLPGKAIAQVKSRASIKGFSDATPPIMIGEFESEDGANYVMLVNLSLEKSTNIILHTSKEYAKKEVVSAADGTHSPLDETNGYWLLPGAGVLIAMK